MTKLYIKTINILYIYAIIITKDRFKALMLLKKTCINYFKKRLNYSGYERNLSLKAQLMLEANKRQYLTLSDSEYDIENKIEYNFNSYELHDPQLKSCISNIMSLPKYRLFGGKNA